MKKYKLIEKNISNEVLPLKKINKRYFFRKNDTMCYTIKSHLDFLIENNINEIDLHLANRDFNTTYFYCKHFNTIGDKLESSCGKLCHAYNPRNKKTGICKDYSQTFEETDRCFTLSLIK